MAKEVKFHKDDIPLCDICQIIGYPENEVQLGIFDAPTRKDSLGRGKWANLCNRHMRKMGIDSSIVTKRVPQ